MADINFDKINYYSQNVWDTVASLSDDYPEITIDTEHPMFKYSEDRILREVREYVEKTYNEHYAVGGKGIQTTEFIIDNGHGVGFTVGNIIKYAQRYGKKEGRNRKDILKVIHYAIMLLHVHDLETNDQKENT